MALSFVNYTGNGSNKNFAVTFPYIAKSDVSVLVDNVSVPYTWLNPSTVQTATAPAIGAFVQVRRQTQKTAPLVDFQDASTLTESDLDLFAAQLLYSVQEAFDSLTSIVGPDVSSNQNNAHNLRIVNVADPINDQDAVTKKWAETASTSVLAQTIAARDVAVAAKNNASTSEGNASSSASSALSAKTAAEAARDLALSARDIAITQAGIASNKATDADTARIAAEAARDAAISAKLLAEAARDLANSYMSAASGHASNASASATSAASSAAAAAASAAGAASNVVPQARITLTSGVAVTVSDVAGATNLYLTPVGGNLLILWDGVKLISRAFSELVCALDATNHVSNTMFDCFVTDDAGTLRFGTGPSWAAGGGSNTARGVGLGSTEIENINGIWVNKNQITLRYGPTSTVVVPARKATYMGSFCTVLAGQTEDSEAKRLVFNAYVQAERRLWKAESTPSWPYNLNSYRVWNGNANNCVFYVVGLGGAQVQMTAKAIALNSAAAVALCYVGIGVDSQTVNNSRTLTSFARISDTTGVTSPITAFYSGPAQLGVHYLAPLEKGANNGATQTWFGLSGGEYLSAFYGSISMM